MENNSKQDKVNRIKNMIFELAIGNWTYRIIINTPIDELDHASITLNNIADTIEAYKLQLSNSEISNSTNENKNKLSSEELAKSLLVYIHNNLSSPLPSIKTLAKYFKTNDCNLKDSFKKTTNTSIHQYYNDERLKKSYLLIEQTSISLKEIAFQCGFNSYLNFYKAFRKKYNCSPSEITRPSDFG
jgi:AraC-like DNA-binding protein